MITSGMGLTLSSGLVSLFSFAVGGLGLAYLLSDQVGSWPRLPSSALHFRLLSRQSLELEA